MAYIGSTPTTQSFISGTDYFNGTGSQTSFTLSRPVVSVNDIQATVNNVVQQPNDAYNVSGNTITFTSAPSSGTGNVYVRYMSTTTQSITPSQNTVSYATWDNDLRNETFAFKNRIINGDMAIDQRNAGAAVTVNSGGVFYPVDRFFGTGQATDGVFTLQQNSSAPAGFVNSIRATVTTADASIGADQSYSLQHRIEGFNTADLAWGTVNAQSVTLSFWVFSSLTGTFGGSVTNSAFDRVYPFSYSISAANTWEQKSVTIVGDTTGTWLTNNGTGIQIIFGLGAGSNRTATAGSWTSTVARQSTGSVNLISTNGATWQVTGVQLEKGTTATNFDVLPYGTELQLCQRYCQMFNSNEWNDTYRRYATVLLNTANSYNGIIPLLVKMRASPALTTGGSFSLWNGSFLSSVVAPSIASASADVVDIAGSNGSGTNGGVYHLLSNNNNTSFMLFTAEL